MKKIFTMLALLITINVSAQKKEIKNIEYPDRNFYGTISLMNHKWEIVQYDSLYNEYTILIGWFYRPDKKEDIFPVTVSGTLKKLNEWSQGDTSLCCGTVHHALDYHEHALTEDLTKTSKYRFCISYCEDPWYSIDPDWGKWEE